MDRSSASEPSPKERKHTTFLHPDQNEEYSVHPTTGGRGTTDAHATVPSTVNATQPPETSSNESYVKIIKDMMGKFSTAGKISDLLTHMADEIRKEEANPNPLPLEISTEPTLPVRAPAAQPLDEPTTSSTLLSAVNPTRHNRNQEDEAEVEEGEEGNSQGEGRDGEGNEEAEEGEEKGQRNEKDENQERLVERRYAERAAELVVLEDKGSEDDEKTLTERAVRRNLRTTKKQEQRVRSLRLLLQRVRSSRRQKERGRENKQQVLRRGSRDKLL